MTAILAPGVAVVMPVHRRALELPGEVETVLAALDEAGGPHRVIVVDDASPDSTAETAEWLAYRYPGRVEAVRRTSARDHDAAVRAGVEAALAHTDHARVLVVDVHRKRWAADLPGFLADADRADRADPEGADVVLGRRPGRFGRRSRDEYELLDRGILETTDLSGDQPAGVGQDLLARVRAGGARVVERPVLTAPATHAPAPAAEERAAGPGLVTRTRERFRWRRPGGGTDLVLLLVTLGSAVGSVLALLHVYAEHAVLAYPDAEAHQLIARRVIESPTPGLTQFGAVWLPLPHALALPFVGIDSLYYSGIGASIVSMVAYVLTARYLYKLVVELTGNRAGGVVAAAVFALNANVLYMQSTPMSELPFLCTLVAATYHLTRWCRTDRHTHLALAALAALLATLTRYESWVFVPAMAVVVVVVAWQRGRGRRWTARLRRAEAHVVYFGVIAFSGVIGWLAWNQLIFRDVRFFYDGEFAKVDLQPDDIADGSWAITLKTYWYAVVDNVGVPLVIAGVAALVLFLAVTWARRQYLAAVTPLVLLPFFLWFLYSGSRPMHVTQVNGGMYNVRFGLLMIIPVAVLLGFAASWLAMVVRDRRGWVTAAVAVALVVVASLSLARGGTATLYEAYSFRSVPQEQANARAAAWWRQTYSGGSILMDTPGSETIVGDARLPTQQIVYDGSYHLWDPALADPARQHIDWIYMRGDFGSGGSVGGLADRPDRVWDALTDTPELAGYRLVYDADERRIYHRLGAP